MANTFIPTNYLTGPQLAESLLTKTKLSKSAILLYSIMVDVSRDGKTYCWASQGFLAKKLGTSTRSIRNYLKELNEVKLIRTENNYGSNIYHFLKSDLITFKGKSPKGSFKGAIVPSSLLESGISHGASLLYACMANLMRDGKNYCWASQNYLAKKINYSLRSVQNFLKELEEKSLIKIKKVKGRLRYFFLKSDKLKKIKSITLSKLKENSSLQKQHAKFSCIKSRLCSISVIFSYPMEKFSGACAKLSAIVNKINQKEKHTPPISPIKESAKTYNKDCGVLNIEKEFQKIWNKYPIKENKNAAWRIFHKLQKENKLPNFKFLQTKIDENIKHNERWSRGFIPFLSNWLRDERWNEELRPTHKKEHINKYQDIDLAKLTAKLRQNQAAMMEDV